MIRIRTGSRLHFGLFSLPSESATEWLNQEGQATLPRPHFGGVGLMIDRPGLDLTVSEAKEWSAEGPLAERALRYAQIYCSAAGVKGAFQVRVASAAPEHAGLGTGTQLGLAVATAITDLTKVPASGRALAGMVGRGLRSAIGVFGFDFGGFIVEGGKITKQGIAPLLFRGDFPEEWRILLITPRGLHGAHGRREIDAFALLANQEADDRTTDALCRLVLLGLLPGLLEKDLTTFGEALYDFNRRVGEMFRPAQGGVYAHPRIEEIVSALRQIGVKGVGQSSWGPTIFAVVMLEQVADIRAWLLAKTGLAREEIITTWASNRGANKIRSE